jgi:hypothetical protein
MALRSIYYRVRPQLPHLIAALTFGLAGGVVTTEGVQQSAEFLTVPGTALIGAAVSELARLVNNVAEERAREQSVEHSLLQRDLQEELVRSILKLRTLLEETPGIPTSIRQEQLETLRKYQELIGELGYLTTEQHYEIVDYLLRLKEEYPEKLERYAQTYGYR